MRWLSHAVIIKRIVDLLAAAAGLLLLSPLFLLVALLIKLESPGPVFFRQERVGRNFRFFKIVKFRTMADAPGTRITVGDDPRVTLLGRWLRRAKIDELPQLWNVIKGEMSLVGPRPEVPHYVQQFHRDYEQILQVPPGITDLASIEFSGEATLLGQFPDPERAYVERILPRKLELGKRYVRERSFWLDARILANTMTRLFTG